MEKNSRKPNLAATVMAAVPYRNVDYAVDVILENFPEAPCLPVTTRGIRWMLEGIPCLIFDREKRQISMAPPEERESELLEFYEKVEQGDLDYFATTANTAPALYRMIEKLKVARPPGLEWVFYRTAGPVLLGDTLKQVNGKPAIHHETLRDILIKGINMKARWAEKKLHEEIPNVAVVADLAEPTLFTFTAAGGTGTRKDVIAAINEGFQCLNCTTWIHCCANIDWSLLIDTCVDVINFDAYQHAESVSLYAKELKLFLERGGMLGWGIVPVIKDVLRNENVQSLVQKLEEGMGRLVKKGIDEEMLVSASWILPSCETVMLTPDESDHVFRLCKAISDTMRSKYSLPTPEKPANA